MTATENPSPPSYNEAILQRKLSELAIREENVVVDNAGMNDDINQLPSPSKDESDKLKQEIISSNEQIDHKNGNPVTVGRVLLIGLLLIVSPWCACKMMKDTSRSTNRGSCRTRGSCCGIDRMERQRLRGERRIERLERRIERKTEKIDKKEAKDKLCDRKRGKYENKIQRWENKIEQRQEMINSRCRAAHPKVVRC